MLMHFSLPQLREWREIRWIGVTAPTMFHGGFQLNFMKGAIMHNLVEQIL